MDTNIPTPQFLAEISEKGNHNFEQDVLNGPIFKKFVRAIEDSALEGFTGYRHKIYPGEDDRALKVIQKALKEAGYKCEFEEVKKKGLVAEYTDRYFHIKWSK